MHEIVPTEAPPGSDLDGSSGRLEAGPTPFGRFLEGSGWRRVRFSGDLVALILAAVAAGLGAPAGTVSELGRAMLVAYVPAVLCVFFLRGLYKDSFQVRLVDVAARIVAATSLAAMVLVAVAALTEPENSAARLIARSWLFASFYLVGIRSLMELLRRLLRASGHASRRTLIVGAGRVGATIERRLRNQPEIGLKPVGYLDLDPILDDPAFTRIAPVLGPPSELGEIAERTGARHVILAFVAEPDQVLLPIVRECERRKLEISLVPRLFEGVSERMTLDHLGGLPVLALSPVDPKGWQFALKHLVDRVVASLALLLLSPLLIAVALVVNLSSPGPVFFRQRRVGRDGRSFEMLKFRSMRAADETTNTPVPATADLAPGGVEGEDRRTPVGSLLRRSSVDELPQLINVLKGEMSIVGPRPERPEYVELFGDRILGYGDRHRVKSGITGWAQVHGLRGQTSLSDRLEWDNYYIQNWSLGLDLKIILMTLRTVLRAAE